MQKFLSFFSAKNIRTFDSVCTGGPNGSMPNDYVEIHETMF